MIDFNIISAKKSALIYMSKRWAGVMESGGENKGQLVEIWQKSVDQISNKEPWCMSFVVSQIIDVDNLFLNVFSNNNFSKVYKSEHVLTCWNKTSKDHRLIKPEIGSIAIWKMDGSSSGHAGIVTKINNDYKTFYTIEGNTSPGGEVIREGQGVFEKLRTMDGQGKMRLLGFLAAWI